MLNELLVAVLNKLMVATLSDSRAVCVDCNRAIYIYIRTGGVPPQLEWPFIFWWSYGHDEKNIWFLWSIWSIFILVENIDYNLKFTILTGFSVTLRQNTKDRCSNILIIVIIIMLRAKNILPF